MNKEEAIKELKSYLAAKKDRESIERRMFALKCEMEYPSHNGESIDGGIKNERPYSNMDKLLKLEEQYDLQRLRCTGIENDISVKINMLEFPYNVVLREYYIADKKLEQICPIMSYSYTSVKRKKGIAEMQYAELPELFSKEYWDMAKKSFQKQKMSPNEPLFYDIM